MKVVKISRWGNSQGIRIPKGILKQIGITDVDSNVEMNVENDTIVITKKTSASKIMDRFKNYDYSAYLNDNERNANFGPAMGRELL